MGMSASQARLISLKARQNNLEYQGQQINQERTILSQQCTDLYNSLLNMNVPTPPSTSDFTTIQYGGTQGASKFTLGSITPKDNGTYNVEMKYKRNGKCVEGGTFKTIETYNVPEFIYGKTVENYTAPTQLTAYTKLQEIDNNTAEKLESDTVIMHSIASASDAAQYKLDSDTDQKFYYQLENGTFIETNSFDEAKGTGDKPRQVFVKTTVGTVNGGDPKYDWDKEENGVDYQINTESTALYTGGLTKDQIGSNTFFIIQQNGESKIVEPELKGQDEFGNDIYSIPDGAYQKTNDENDTRVKNGEYDETLANKNNTIDGQLPVEFSKTTLGDSYASALQSIANSMPEFKDANGNPDATLIESSFMVVYSTNEAGEQVPCFIKKSSYQQETKTDGTNKQGRIEIFSMIPNGYYNESVPTEGCKLQFDTSGRIIAIEIPINDTNPVKYDKVDVEATKVTDEDAYKDAYAKYEYAMYEYDQKQQEINAKTEIIQQEDRNLELKLTRLDNERTQITTEIEAVEKVIKDDIEASYKTFSG